MLKRFGKTLKAFPGLAAGCALGTVPAAVLRQLEAGERAEAQLGAFLSPANHAALTDWIGRRYSGKTRLAKARRRAAYLIAVELVKYGVSTDELTAYALRQVLDLVGDEMDVDAIQGTACAYGAVHTAGAGPATGGITTAVRQALQDHGIRIQPRWLMRGI